jgi:hypothetical protein
VLALRAFEGPEIESWFIRLNLGEIHSRGAFWAPGAIIHVRSCRCVFELRHLRIPLIQAGALPNSQPPTPGARPLPVMGLSVRLRLTVSESLTCRLAKTCGPHQSNPAGTQPVGSRRVRVMESKRRGPAVPGYRHRQSADTLARKGRIDFPLRENLLDFTSSWARPQLALGAEPRLAPLRRGFFFCTE